MPPLVSQQVDPLTRRELRKVWNSMSLLPMEQPSRLAPGMTWWEVKAGQVWLCLATGPAKTDVLRFPLPSAQRPETEVPGRVSVITTVEVQEVAMPINPLGIEPDQPFYLDWPTNTKWFINSSADSQFQIWSGGVMVFAQDI